MILTNLYTFDFFYIFLKKILNKKGYKMFFTNLFKFKKTCKHDKITPDMESGYCPDCGKFIKNEWYITRCSCCGVKMKANARNNEVFPQYHFCSNCGSKEYTVEKLDAINFIDINFAVLLKNEVQDDLKANTTQCWQERNNVQPKLLVQYL